jgi:hypothetical protein
MAARVADAANVDSCRPLAELMASGVKAKFDESVERNDSRLVVYFRAFPMISSGHGYQAGY